MKDECEVSTVISLQLPYVHFSLAPLVLTFSHTEGIFVILTELSLLVSRLQGRFLGLDTIPYPRGSYLSTPVLVALFQHF